MADKPVLNPESDLPELWKDNGDGTYSLTVSANTGALAGGDLPAWNVLRGVLERWKSNGGGTYSRCLTTVAGAGVLRWNSDTGRVEKYVSQQSGSYYSRLVTAADGAGVTVVDNNDGVARKYVDNGDGTFSELLATSAGAGATAWNSDASLTEKFVGAGPYGRLVTGLVTAPAADFTGTPLSGTTPLSVTFTDASTNTPTSWLWEKNSGSGWVNFAGTPAVQNPTESFAVGTWSVRLTATNAGGSDTKTRTNYVVSTAAPTTLLQDTFTGADGTNLTAHTMNVGPGWTAAAGSATIQSNQAKMGASSSIYVSDAGQADFTLTLDFTWQGS